MEKQAEIIEVTSTRIPCDGGGGSLGHPRVFLTLRAQDNKMECPYCGQAYVLKPGASLHGDH